jgi:DnaK suppressor protein
MTDPRDLLLHKREEIFSRRRRLEEEWQNLGERDIELEEEAQKANLAMLYDQLGSREKAEIEDIDLALVKVASGRYGLCEGCQKNIEEQRLETLPATRLCIRCARKFEEQHRVLPGARSLLAGATWSEMGKEQSTAGMGSLVLEVVKSGEDLDLEIDEFSEDIFEAQEEDRPYTVPDRKPRGLA